MSKRIITRRVLASFLLWCAFAANAERYTISLLVPPGATGDPQGVVRILNGSQESATVTIHAIDDAGVRTGPATLLLDALAAVELSATELESGDSAKGLSMGLGAPVRRGPPGHRFRCAGRALGLRAQCRRHAERDERHGA